MQKRRLSIVLKEDIDFKDVVRKAEAAFSTIFHSKDKKGRYVAEGEFQGCNVSVIDRIDQLGEFLSDDNHVIDIYIPSDDKFNNEFECEIRRSLRAGNLSWEYAIWSRLSASEEYRKIYPD